MTTVRQLEYFVTVAERGHFGRAAAVLNVTQPALSHQLKALEEDLGVILIERRTSGAELTPIGRELIGHARKILLDLNDMKQLAARSISQPLGRIRVGASPTLGPYLMPRVIEVLHRQNPDLRLFIKEGIPAEQVMQLIDGQIDMLLTPLPVPDHGLHIEPLFREPLHVVVSPDHPLAKRDSIKLVDLKNAAFLTLDHRHHYHRQVAEFAERVGGRVLGDYEGTSLDSLRLMVGSGVGLAILPEFYIRSEAGGVDMVKQLKLEDYHGYRSIAAVWRTGAAYSPFFAAIAETVREQAHHMLSNG